MYRASSRLGAVVGASLLYIGSAFASVERPLAASLLPLSSTHGEEDFYSSSLAGTRGIVAVEAARAIRAHALTLSLREQFFSGRDLIVKGDRDAQSDQALHLNFSLFEGLEVGVRQVSVTNTYVTEVRRSIQVQGNPALHLKLSGSAATLAAHFGPRTIPSWLQKLGVGLDLQLVFPTSGNGGGLAPKAFVLPLKIIGTYRLHPSVEVSANLGYTLDRTRALFGYGPVDALKRMVFQINPQHYGTFAIGAMGRIRVGRLATLLPFAEMVGTFAAGIPTSDNQAFVNLGTKFYATKMQALEVAFGSQVRLAGRPRPGSIVAGLPGWSGFVQLVLHVGEKASFEVPSPINDSRQPPCARFALQGEVRGGPLDEPVPDARVSWFNDSTSQVISDASGKFTLWAPSDLPKSAIVCVRAPGFEPLQWSFQVSKCEAKLPLQITLHRRAPGHPHRLRGRIVTQKGQKPISATLIVLPQATRIEVGRSGIFAVSIDASASELFVMKEGYAIQHHALEPGAGAETILNLELSSLELDPLDLP